MVTGKAARYHTLLHCAASTMASTTGATHEESAPEEVGSAPVLMAPAPPLMVQLLAGNPATVVALLQLLNMIDATALRRLHPAVAVTVETLPWCDTKVGVTDVVRWRAAFPAATGARVVRFGRNIPMTAATLAGLTYLDVSECAMDVMDDFIHCLPPTLQTLDVHDCRRLSGAVSFAHLPALETLVCSGSDIGNRALATLSPSLQVLRAEYCRVSTGADFRHLPALQTLKTSRLPSNNVQLCGSNLPSSLQELKLAGFCLPPHSAPFAHLALCTLELHCCQVPHTALACLPPTIITLVLVICTGLASSSFPHPPLPSLRTLYCPDSDIGDAALASLPPSLAHLTVAGGAARLTPAAVFPPHMPALRDVDMSGTTIGDATIASLPPSLRDLDIRDCTNITPAARLDHFINMKTLNSSGTNLTPSTVAACRARGCNAPADGVLRGHGSNKVLSLAALPDGTLASGDAGGTVRLWAAGDNGAYHALGDGLALVEHDGEVRALVALRDGHNLAAGIKEQWRTRGSVVVWDLCAALPTCTTTIECMSGVTALAQLAGDHLAAGCIDGGIYVVDVTAGSEAGATMAGHTASVTALTMLPDGSTLASGSVDHTVRLWDVGARACVATLVGHSDVVTSLAVLADGKLASGSHDGSVRLWDTASRTCVSTSTIPVHPQVVFRITSLAALPGGGLVGGADGTIGTLRIWGPGALRDSPKATWETGTATALVVLPGNRLASASEDGTVRLWQLPQP